MSRKRQKILNTKKGGFNMKPKTFPKKVTLKKTTVVNLNYRDMNEVRAGVNESSISLQSYCKVCRATGPSRCPLCNC
jgi:hypothetical protein